MTLICPWANPSGAACTECKHDCPQAETRVIVINGLFGVWRAGTTLIVENTDSTLHLSAAHLDSLIAVLEAARQELAQPWEP